MAAAALLYLLATGLPLQFSGQLGLGGRFVTSAPVLDWYGLKAPDLVLVSAGIANVGESLYVDDQVAGPVARFGGAARIGGFIVVAGTDQTLLLDGSGATLERLDHAASRVGRIRDRAVLDTADGLLVADSELLNWVPLDRTAEPIDWSEVRQANATAAQRYRNQYRQRLLSVERLLQDLHSGRAFGPAGIVVVDVASVLLAFLAASGLIMWWRTHAR